MKKILYTLLALSFLDILSFSFILPSLPFIIKNFWWSSIQISYAVSSAALWMFLGWIFFWRLSDKYWRKKILLLSIFFNFIWYLLFAVSKNLELFILSRFICGLGGWWISVVQAYIGDISNEKNRLKNMSLIGATVWLGFTIWPIFGSLLENFWLQNVWYFSAALILISLLISNFVLQENPKIHSHDKLELKWTEDNLLMLFISFFIVTASFAWIQTIFALYLNDIFNFWVKQVAYSLGYIWIIAIIYQGYILHKFGKNIQEKTLIIVWFFLLWIAFLLVVKNTSIYFLYFILALFAIWLSSINSSIYTLISKHSHSKDYGKNMWLNTAFGSIADIIWPLVSWYLYLESFKIPFYFFGLLLLFNIIFIYFLLEKKKKS